MKMKMRIAEHYPHQAGMIADHNSSVYIADYTEQTKNGPERRGVEITSAKPAGINSFSVKNDNAIRFSSITFDNKSFVDDDGSPLSQCECVGFSSAEHSEGPWVLFLELKYCNPCSRHKDRNLHKAKEQLTKTYRHYRTRGIITNKQRCYLVVSFPLLRSPFSSFEITPPEVARMGAEKVIFRGTNELKIKNEFKLEV